MKILIIQNLNKNLGGGDYSLIKYFEYLTKWGHEIYFYGVSRENPFFQEYTHPKNFRIYYRYFFPEKIKGSRIINEWINKIYLYTIIKKLINQKKINLVVGSFRLRAVDAVYLAKKTNIKCINFVFESPPWMKKDLGEEWQKEYVKTKKAWDKTKKAYIESNVLISNSKMSKSYCESWIGKRVTDYVYPGIDTKVVDCINKQKKKYQIIYIGRLYHSKNINEIIIALSKIKNPPPLKIIGGGEELTNIKKLAREYNIKVEFAGIKGDIEKFKEIKKSLFMVFPSSHEGFGIPPLEALYCGIPCICSDKPIFKEVYGNKVEYFKEHNIDELKNKIEFLLKNPDYCEKRGKEGRKYVKKNFSWQKSAKKIERILKTIKIK